MIAPSIRSRLSALVAAYDALVASGVPESAIRDGRVCDLDARPESVLYGHPRDWPQLTGWGVFAEDDYTHLETQVHGAKLVCLVHADEWPMATEKAEVSP